MKKSYKWVVAFAFVVVACLIGGYLRDKYEEKPVMNGFTEVDLSAENISEVMNMRTPESDAELMININTASVKELCLLPQIGEKTAEKIVQFREDYGNFKRVEEIQMVSGIGDKTYKEICNYITIDPNGE